jgi:phosphoribosylaminoimidazole-succinocarboxamide synthase
VRRAPPLPVECIVRGYLAGSVWKGYQQSGKIAGFVDAPKGMVQGGRFPEPLFTPTTKAERGEHDENIPFSKVEELVGKRRAAAIRDLSLAVYETAAAYAETRGVILCDTKLEFGVTPSNELFLIDELLTPDSSRYWPKDQWKAPGSIPPAMDKQVVRDTLEKSGWNKSPPAPRLDDDTVAKTRAAYRQIYRVLTGVELADDPTRALLDADRAGTEAAGERLIGGEGRASK